MFRFYQNLILLRRANRAVRSHNVDVVHAHDANRVIAFTRREATTDVLVAVSLNNRPYDGYTIETGPDRIPTGTWMETFNSDAAVYGGSNTANQGSPLAARNGRIELHLPANDFVVLQRV